MTINTPTIEEVPIAKLFTDHTVQRDLDQKRADRESDEKKFIRAAIGVPRVSAREDGTMHLIDGQHRREMLVLAGFGEDTVTCEVFRGLTIAEEATLFRLANNAKPVGPIDRFRVRVREGERNAVVLNTILERYGWRVRTGAEPGTFAAVRALEGVLTGSLVGAGSTSTVCDTLIRVLTEAWGNDPAVVRGEIVSGLGGVLLRHNDTIDPKRMIDKLRAYEGGAPELTKSARGMRLFRKGTVADSAAEVIVGIYNGKRQDRNSLPAWRAKAPRAVAGPAGSTSSD